MTQTMEIPIGVNAHLDGGPFSAFDGDGIEGDSDPEAGVLVGETNEGIRGEFSIDEIESGLQEAIETGEPVHISTGDVGEYNVGTVKIPLESGYIAEAYTLGEYKNLLSTLRDDELARNSMEKRFGSGGGRISSVDR